MSLAVQLAGITKRFGGVAALDHVDLSVETGTIHAVVGENGAGKTTLMRVLYGALRPDEGAITLSGQAHTFATSAQAISAGVGMVSQHYGIIPGLSCLQNLALGVEGGALLHSTRLKTRADELAARMGFHFDWSSDAQELTPAAAQKLEILKLLWKESRIMILDEPTAMLSPADGAALFESLQKLVSEGATVILVTHRLPEVIDYCQRVTVLRGGKKVADLSVAETNAGELASLIVGSSLGSETAGGTTRESPREDRNATLMIDKVSVRDDRRHIALRHANLTMRPGEIVGVAGVDGNGQRELFQVIAGLAKPIEGMVQLFGQDSRNASPADRLARGLQWIPEDRHSEAVIDDWSLEWNAILGLHRTKYFAPDQRRTWAEKVAAKFSTKHGGLNQPMSSLSGGNQQRFVAARALEADPKLLLAFQPARGLDLKGTADVYAAIRAHCDGGMAALIVSFDLDELLAHCDRIVVLNGGVLQEAPGRDREAIGRLMVGADA